MKSMFAGHDTDVVIADNGPWYASAEMKAVNSGTSRRASRTV